MTGAEAIGSAEDALFTVVIVSAPLMAVGTIIGVLVSLLQAWTQIQEQTLIYVPKIVATFITPSLGSLRVPADRDHRFQAIVITHSRAS
jgi:flagellar biosynthetic protein FliQ